MSQNESISYPKIHQRADGKVEVIVYYKGKRMRLQNGRAFSVNLKPNSFPLTERINQGNILAAEVYSKLLTGTVPTQRGRQPILENQSDLYYLEQALKRKLKEGHSKHHLNALKLAYERIKDKAINGEVSEAVV
ncbi:MAG: hypothetical protein ISP51_02025, partial [Flavobacteriaceae bacterium]|nr:hypothetical protein [Flavobacteriaceae bacterium]